MSWPTGTPAEAGFDEQALAQLDRHLQASNSSCLVIVRDGEVVHEGYWNGGAPTKKLAAWSVTKSMTATLVGIAADEGLLDIDDKASEYIPQWRGTPADDVTIRDLLSNVSGRRWDYRTDYEKMALSASDKTNFAIELPQVFEPGEVWAYNNSAIQTLSAVLREATGREARVYARGKLLDPLGMTNTTWGNDASGHTMTFAGVSSTCLDLARFGQTMLDGGVWNDQRVVSEDFVDEATGESSSDLNAAYGLLWWVNQSGTVLGALQATDPQATVTGETDTQLAPRAPADAFWALGLGGQQVAVVPSLDLVAVRMGTQPRDREAVSPDRITGDLVDALK